MSTFLDLERSHARLAILRLLAEATGYSLNDSIIHAALPAMSFHWSRDAVRSELAWLEEQGLVSAQDYQTLKVAQITERGLDVAQGGATVPGVQRPGPRPLA